MVKSGNGWTLLHEDCRQVARDLGPAAVDTIITDPPYGLQFMGKDWDRVVPGREYWETFKETLKPGGMLFAFAYPKLYHRLAVAVEDAGLEIRDVILWLHGQGMPKGLDVGRATGREEFTGYHTGLNPAWEAILVAQRPPEGTYKANALKYGLAGYDIDRNKVPPDRWPSNLVLSHLDLCSPDLCHPLCPIALLDSMAPVNSTPSRYFARIIYHPKADRKEKDAGLQGLFKPKKGEAYGGGREGVGKTGHYKPRLNDHPTVKPIGLLEWLTRLAKPPAGGKVWDPYAGTGTGGIGAFRVGMEWIGSENKAHNFNMAAARLRHWTEDQEFIQTPLINAW